MVISASQKLEKSRLTKLGLPGRWAGLNKVCFVAVSGDARPTDRSGLSCHQHRITRRTLQECLLADLLDIAAPHSTLRHRTPELEVEP